MKLNMHVGVCFTLMCGLTLSCLQIRFRVNEQCYFIITFVTKILAYVLGRVSSLNIQEYSAQPLTLNLRPGHHCLITISSNLVCVVKLTKHCRVSCTREHVLILIVQDSQQKLYVSDFIVKTAIKGIFISYVLQVSQGNGPSKTPIDKYRYKISVIGTDYHYSGG